MRWRDSNPYLAEGAYTLEPFRGLHLQGAVAAAMYVEACGPEIKAIYAHVAPDSRTVRAKERLGFEPYLRQTERYRFGRLSISRSPWKPPPRRPMGGSGVLGATDQRAG